MKGSRKQYRIEDLPERMQVKIEIDAASGCWVWQGCPNSSGYGVIWFEGGSWYVHRLAFHLLHDDDLPPFRYGGMELDHVKERGCTSRACCNPRHLELVPHIVNMRRGDGGKAGAARQRAKTHCPQGHPYSGPNLYVASDGKRYCRECNAVWGRANPERAKAIQAQYRARNRDKINAKARAKRRALKDL